MRTWEDELRERGEDIGISQYRCPACSRAINAFAIVQEDDGAWRCTTCRIEAERETHLPHVADWNDVRGERDRILAETDWTEAPGPRRSMTDAQAANWEALRAQLRDVPQTADTPDAALALLGDLRLQAQGLRTNNPKE